MLIPSTMNCTPATPTVSVAVAETITFAPATVAPLAGAVIVVTGIVVSRTVIVNEASIVLPRVSPAGQSIVVVPSGDVEPLNGGQFTGAGPSAGSLAGAG